MAEFVGFGGGEASAVDGQLHHLFLEQRVSWPYSRRRAALEALFAERQLSGSLALCPSTTDPDEAREWLNWTAAGLEGLCFKRLGEPYLPGRRAWRKYKVRETTEALVGAITGTVASPTTLLPGRYDQRGHLHYTGHTTVLRPGIAREVAGHLSAGRRPHPWQGRTFTAGWGSRETLEVVLVQPDIVLEIAADVARDAAGRWRHPVRAHRIRTDVGVEDVPLLGEREQDAGTL
ncbi:hypothetical protein ACGF07_33740 [Kitasatospora sp. NPDC048194]|uniref:ATP-dependent DNA ligase n=1 Tax=Kitasatospora sp. NPDC048194 TaxID=3364045 RepID=UPI0037233B86